MIIEAILITFSEVSVEKKHNKSNWMTLPPSIGYTGNKLKLSCIAAQRAAYGNKRNAAMTAKLPRGPAKAHNISAVLPGKCVCMITP